jgi:hypothetical protein
MGINIHIIADSDVSKYSASASGCIQHVITKEESSTPEAHA